ncbi:uncharacterized protein LOC105171248 isoform X2 [Sesamum indicum]|uniref:Uncharacterized protein LOC105171248 isoform X2 n=1 Tax=Sesamum indicum TaxID=4182 RepID=A0A6I9U9H6_SESIN|nr:uncharacterized protein LOC105171248 isoform X2 [Sesamum indicum]
MQSINEQRKISYRSSTIGHLLPPINHRRSERCYKQREDNSWSGPRAAKVVKMLEDRQPQPTIVDLDAPAESEAWVAMMEQQMRQATVGSKKNGRVFDLDFETHASSRTFTPPPPPPPPPPSPYSAMEDASAASRLLGLSFIFVGH